jgi:hypothetical protein
MTDEKNKFIFENGMVLQEVFANHVQRNLKLTASLLDVALLTRDFWIQISGESQKIKRAKEFFTELTNVCQMRKRSLDQNDFEQVLRAFKNDSVGELKELFAEKIKVGPNKRDIVPRSRAQLDYLRSIRKNDIVFERFVQFGRFILRDIIIGERGLSATLMIIIGEGFHLINWINGLFSDIQRMIVVIRGIDSRSF